MIYGSVNPPVYSRIPRTARTLLDVGCGDGTLGRKLESEWAVQVTGITHSSAEAELARNGLVKVVVADLNDFDPVGLGRFDCIVCSHVLEHLQAPGELLRRLRGNLSSGSCLIVALPNLLHWRQRLDLLRGRFRYTEGGLMDRTHLRFFDWETAAGLLRDTGYELVERIADGTFPASRFLGIAGRLLDGTATRMLPGLFGWQFVLTARLQPENRPGGPA